MKNIEYKFTPRDSIRNFDAEDIDIFLEKATPNSCPWHKLMPSYTNSSAKSYIDHWKSLYQSTKSGQLKEEHLNIEFSTHKGYSMTGKKCPGILGVLNKSYLVKSPVETVIHVEDNAIQSLHCADDRMMKVASHDVHQYRHNNSKIFHNKQSVKFSLPVVIKTSSPYVFMNPTYHLDYQWEVLPGVIEDHHTHCMSLIVHCMIDVTQNKYITIKPGDPIAYLWLPEKTKLKYNENLKDKRFMKYFNQPKNWFGKN